MMEQLIKVSSVPFQAIRFTQNARLVPADNMALERHKALVRHHAFLSRFRAAPGWYACCEQGRVQCGVPVSPGKTVSSAPPAACFRRGPCLPCFF